MTQAQALAILKTGANVFLTGEPGSGKTHTINQYVVYLRERGIEPAITASTGIAATHLGGVTIHSWSGIGIKTKLDPYELDRISTNEYLVRRISRAKILIIDEVSMLLPEVLSGIEAICREIRRREEPFGGLQVILVGDFFQLPPVAKIEDGLEPSARFAFAASSWADLNSVVCYLTEQHRQNDGDFLSVLSAIRSAAVGEEHRAHLKKRKIEAASAPATTLKLFSHNADVDRLNNEMLSKLPGQPCVFKMTSVGSDAVVAALKKGCLSPERLELKIGAAVMFTKNNPRAGFWNGTLGTVLGFNKETGQPVVKTRDGERLEVEAADWSVEERGRIRGQITQVPLRLAWAITVHKSQGMSLDEAVMDLSEVFEFGQGYVALSRVRSLNGLYLLGWNERTFQVHPEILTKDEAFRQASTSAEAAFAKISPVELKKMHSNFVTACGGKRWSGFKKIREKYENAYKPWDEEQDKKLRELFGCNMSVADMAKMFGRKTGAIRSRLAKLGLME